MSLVKKPVLREAVPALGLDRAGSGGTGVAVLVDVERPVLRAAMADPAHVLVVVGLWGS
jgi:hypothetical protein